MIQLLVTSIPTHAHACCTAFSYPSTTVPPSTLPPRLRAADDDCADLNESSATRKESRLIAWLMQTNAMADFECVSASGPDSSFASANEDAVAGVDLHAFDKGLYLGSAILTAKSCNDRLGLCE